MNAMKNLIRLSIQCLASFRKAGMASILALMLVSPAAEADTIYGTGGLSIQAEVLSLQDGQLTVKSAVGTHNIPLADVTGFKIERATTGEIPPATGTALPAGQAEPQQILARLDGLTAVIANLERQLVQIQSNQEHQAQRLLDRTYDLNPHRNLKVQNTRINTRSGGTLVTGQIVNESNLPMSNIQVEVVLKGRSGKIRLSGGEKRQTAMVEPAILEPGKIGTFTARFESGLLVTDVDVFPHAFNPSGFSSANPNQAPGY